MLDDTRITAEITMRVVILSNMQGVAYPLPTKYTALFLMKIWVKKCWVKMPRCQ